MILRRLRLKNYRKYRTLELEFPTGLIGVMGRNGSGKTTIFEAVAFAMYGSVASRTKAKGIRRDGAGTDENCEVELEFALGGDPYRIVRSLKGATEVQQAAIYGRGSPEPIAAQASGVQVTVRRLLGMDYHTFTRSVFSKQKEVNALSAARPEERRQAIRRMIGLDTITRARDAAKTERRTTEAQIQGARQALEVLPSKRDEMKKLEPQVRTTQADVIEKARHARAAAGTARANRAKLKRLEEKRRAHTELEREESGVAGDLRGAHKHEQKLTGELVKLKQARRELTNLQPRDREFERVRRAKESLDRASGKHDERVHVEGEIASVSTDAKLAASDLQARGKAVAKFRGTGRAEKEARTNERKASSELAKLQRQRGGVQNQLGRAESQAKRVANDLLRIRKLGPLSKCPTCYQKLGDSFQEINTHLKAERDAHVAVVNAQRKRLRAVNKAIADANRRVETAAKQVETAASTVTKAARASEKLRAARQVLAQVTNVLRSKRARFKTLSRIRYDEGKHQAIQKEYGRLSAIHDQVERLRNAVTRLPSVRRELSSTVREVKDLTRHKQVIKRSKAALKFDHDKHSSARRALDSAQAADKASALAHTEAKGELSKLRDALGRVRDEIRYLERLQSRIAKDEEEVRYLTRIEALLDAFRSELINRVRPQLEEHASSLFDQMTSGRYPKITLDEDYNIFIHDGTSAYPIRRFSGGEEDLANLCLRIAISQVVAERAGAETPTFIVLDEIFGSQDVERRERILQASMRLQEIFPQIIIITHMEDIEDRLPNVLRVTENAVGEAEVAWA